MYFSGNLVRVRAFDRRPVMLQVIPPPLDDICTDRPVMPMARQDPVRTLKMLTKYPWVTFKIRRAFYTVDGLERG